MNLRSPAAHTPLFASTRGRAGATPWCGRAGATPWCGMLAAVLAAPLGQAADTWPAGAEQRLEWRVPAGTGTRWVRVPDYASYTRVAKTAVVCDETGTPTAWHVTGAGAKEASARPELWFQATDNRRYFSYWGASLKVDAKGKPTKEPPTADANAPLATPGELLRRPTWKQRDGHVEQTSRGRNVFLVAQPEFTDFVLTLRIRPGKASDAGVAVRCAADTPDSSGAYWLLGRVQAATDQGSNAVWGVVRDAQRGPALVVGEWNDLRIVAEGRRLSLAVNGAAPKEITLPEDKARAGTIALATYGGNAEFADVRVTSLDGRQVLFEDRFAGTDIDPTRWRDADGARVRGFLRIVNAPDTARTFQLSMRFHRDPWSLRAVPTDSRKTPPGEPTPWLHPGSLVPKPPFTVSVAAREGDVAGRLECVSALFDAPPLRSFEFPEGKSFEINQTNIFTAAQLKTSEEIGRATLEAVSAMTFKGRPPERFPTGYPQGNTFDLRAGRHLGFNATHGLAGGLSGTDFTALGFRHVYGYTHLLTASGKGSGYKMDVNREQMQRLASSYRKAGLIDHVHTISVFDEPGFNIKKSMQKGLPDMSKDPPAWSQIIAAAGLTPADLIHPDDPPPSGADPMSKEYWQKVRGWTEADRERNPEGVYRTMRVFQAIYPTRFRNARTAIREAFGEQVLVTANVHADHWFRGTLTDIEPWGIYSELQALDVPQACDYNVGWPQNEEFLIDMMRCAVRPHDRPVQAYLAAQASYMTRSSASLRLRALSAIGAGARGLAFYEWGPRRQATENWYDTDRGKLRAIGEINHAVGWVEDVLMEGGPRLPRVAILCSRASDLWDVLDVGATYARERRQLFHLLRGLHRQVDFLNDDFLPDDTALDHYKVIFLSQRCLARAHADRLLAWVGRGGTLVATVGCGQLDELARPGGRLAEAFGIRGVAIATGPRTVGEVTTSNTVVDLEAAGAADDVAARFAEGGPAIVTRTQGAGRLVYCGFFLGGSYHAGGVKMANDVLLGMQGAVRDLVAPWLDSAGPPECATDDPLVGGRLVESPQAGVVVLVNATGAKSLDRVRVRVQSAGTSAVESLQHGPLDFQPIEGGVEFVVPLHLTDVIRLQRK